MTLILRFKTEAEALTAKQFIEDSQRLQSNTMGKAESVVLKHEPDGFAYRYPDGIRYGTHGRSINGSDPIESIPFFVVEDQTQEPKQ